MEHIINRDEYLMSFGVEHIPKEIRTFIVNKNIKTNIFRIQAYDLIKCADIFVLDLLVLCLRERL